MKVWLMYEREGVAAVGEHDTLSSALEAPELQTAVRAEVVIAGQPTRILARLVMLGRGGRGMMMTPDSMALAASRLPPRVASSSRLM